MRQESLFIFTRKLWKTVFFKITYYFEINVINMNKHDMNDHYFTEHISH